MQISKTKWMVSPYFYLSAAGLLLLFPLKWVVGWMVAAGVHELFHYVALRLLGEDIYRVTIGFSGAVMETGEMNKKSEAICAFAGPLGGICLLFTCRWLPQVAICALFQTVYNLLPILPLDGGRVLHSVLKCVISEQYVYVICRLIENLIFAALLTLSVIALLNHYGMLPLLFTGILFLKTRKENPLAN